MDRSGGGQLYTMLRFLAGLAFTDTSRNCETTVNAIMRFGNIHETVKADFELLECKPARCRGQIVQRHARVSASHPSDFERAK